MLGCLVLLAGTIVLVATVAEVAKGASRTTVARMAVLGCGLVLIGGPLFCGERGKLFDRQCRTMTSWLGMFRPLWRTTLDLSPYQSVGIETYDEAGVTRWHVHLLNAQGERLDVFDLADREAAECAARQVAGFLSLALAAQPPVAGPVPAAVSVSPDAGAAPSAEACWVYRRHFGPVARLFGVILASLAIMVILGIASAAAKENGRWLPGAAAVSPLLVLGLWLLFGGRRVAVDHPRQTVRVWRAWPLPPAVYDLGAFHAVMVAAVQVAEGMVADQEATPHCVGLLDREQQRLELTEGLPYDDALAAAGRLAASVQLPLIDERQAIVNSQRVAGRA
ncbi:MAG: hypothetical protein B7Z73_04505 [Planctomycetia bacterium 21-64-5]|nr:MAG: hypothetical protein B7Z73_04505 [Planctomycetia bacterium 21-64-5]HQU43114.1 hypothetical protein [Pirellulales bacterium]